MQSQLLSDVDTSTEKVADWSVPYISQMVPRLWKSGMFQNTDLYGKYLTVTMNRTPNLEHGDILNDQSFITKKLWLFIQ